MNTINTQLNTGTVTGRVAEHLKLMDALFLDMTKDDDDEIQKHVRDALTAGGKRIRPTLAFLASDFGECTSDEIVPLMAMIELMHSGSLVHDDVVDHANLRRGRPTINSERGDHIAVQCGDYALARSMPLLTQYHGTGINEILAKTSMEMCLGELQQIRCEYDFSIQSPEDYLLRIKRKTAYLMAASCKTGAIAGNLSASWQDTLYTYGLSFGIIFQLMDDILDYEGADKEGKPLFQDLCRGIFTLPLLHTLKANFEPRFAKLLQIRDKTEADCISLAQWVKDSGGINYTRALAASEADKAIDALAILPDTEAKTMLIQMMNKVYSRK